MRKEKVKPPTRVRPVPVYFLDTEREVVRVAAAKCGKSMSEYGRTVILAAATKAE